MIRNNSGGVSNSSGGISNEVKGQRAVECLLQVHDLWRDDNHPPTQALALAQARALESPRPISMWLAEGLRGDSHLGVDLLTAVHGLVLTPAVRAVRELVELTINGVSLGACPYLTFLSCYILSYVQYPTLTCLSLSSALAMPYLFVYSIITFLLIISSLSNLSPLSHHIRHITSRPHCLLGC